MLPPVFKRSKLPAEQQQIALRIREERKLEKFSQAELAFESGIGRASLTHYEYAITALPFSAGIKLCRRLDVNPIWLATGKDPRRPYVPLSDLGLESRIEDLHGGTFLDGYRELLAAPLRKWRANHGDGALIMAQLYTGTDRVFARMSKLSLEKFIREWSAKLREEECPRMKLAVLGNILSAGNELKRRLEVAAETGIV